jgi:hypothetical protein
MIQHYCRRSGSCWRGSSPSTRRVAEARRESIGRVGVLRQQAKQNHRNVHGGLSSLATRMRWTVHVA